MIYVKDHFLIASYANQCNKFYNLYVTKIYDLMKSISYIVGLITLVLVYSCGSTQSAVSESDMAALSDLVEGRKFRIESDWADPTVTRAMMQVGAILGPQNSVARINLIGNDNYLEVRGDSVKSDLPYFGERQMGGGYNTNDIGIKIDEVARDMELHYLDSKKKYKMSFKAGNVDTNESYNVVIEIFSNKKTSIIVTSTERNSIRYEGTIMPLLEE
ncbi:hypothetical protein P278_15780 [Zhouia amylolytica AD3]|uniref:DUF4251 domain-containing protein n=2 Tax=Zhouia amylolytica TaxID=376730 RepID=W2UQV7_9FLAO|nr:hypothetical protein P278_15780 [Zhouia amylolytica AD3]